MKWAPVWCFENSIMFSTTAFFFYSVIYIYNPRVWFGFASHLYLNNVNKKTQDHSRCISAVLTCAHSRRITRSLKFWTFHRPLCDLTWSIRVDQYKKEMKIISHDLKKKIRIKRVWIDTYTHIYIFPLKYVYRKVIDQYKLSTALPFGGATLETKWQPYSRFPGSVPSSLLALRTNVG